MINLDNKIKELLLKKDHVVISLDGRSGVGKSAIAQRFSKQFEVVIINCDDFYSGAEDGDEDKWYEKTPQEKVDQVIDYDRVKSEVLSLLLSNKVAKYHPFNFKSGVGFSKEIIQLKPAPLIIIDGVYSSEFLKDLVDISVLVKLPNKLRRERLLKREGEEFMKDWHAKWDDAEDYYFIERMPENKFDFVINGELDK